VTSNGGNRWAALRIDMQAFLIATSFAFISMFLSNPQDAKQLALMAVGFQLAMEMTRNFDMAIRWSVNLENSMLSVQRLLAYANLEFERPGEANGKVSLQENPRTLKGKIEFTSVEMSYKPGLRPALQNLSFVVNPGEQIAVVGRTGAGKSSLF